MKSESYQQNRNSLSYTTTAALMGIGFAMALGATAYTGSLVKRSGYSASHHAAMEEALAAGDFRTYRAVVEDLHPGALVTEAQFARAQARRAARLWHQEELERVLASGSYEEWLAYMRQHPRISAAISEEKALPRESIV